MYAGLLFSQNPKNNSQSLNICPKHDPLENVQSACPSHYDLLWAFLTNPTHFTENLLLLVELQKTCVLFSNPHHSLCGHFT